MTQPHDKTRTVEITIDCIDYTAKLFTENKIDIIHRDVLIKHALTIEFEAQHPL